MTLVTIIGRGHSGTRAISHTLSASGVYMGASLNLSGDLVPPESMYAACRILAQSIEWKGGLEWNWDRLLKMEIPSEFTSLLEDYLSSVLSSDAAYKGWKIPETTLVAPWIQRRFPEAKYIFWIRNPRDCILGRHLTDDLNDFGIPYPPSEDIRLQRAISWKYQYDLVRSMPKPSNWIEVRFEDFVLQQDETLARLEEFLGLKLAKVEVRSDSIGRYRQDDGVNYYDFFEPAMRAYGYEIPAKD